MTSNDMQKIKWAGWVIVGAVGLVFSGWMAAEVVGNGTRIAVVEDRQMTQFEHLRDDIAEIKALVKEAQ